MSHAAAPVVEAVKSLFRAYECKDVDSVLGCFLCEKQCRLSGHCTRELTRTPQGCRAELGAQLQGTDSVHVEFLRTRTTVRDHSALVVADCRFIGQTDGRRFVIPTRVRALLEKRDGRWLISRVHGPTT